MEAKIIIIMKTKSFVPQIMALAVAVNIVSACSPQIFQQITTLNSEQVTLKDNGDYVAETPLFTIEYDFWSTNGNVCFTITNNSNVPLYLNLAESFFVNNGYAYDYYKARTYVYSHKSTVGYGTTGSTSIAGSVMAGQSASVTGQGLLYPIASASASVGASLSKTYGASSSVSMASQNGYSVEYAEKDVVCIPAHSSKSFEEFIVSSDLHRECGFARNPSKKETMVKEYNADNSPRVIENRLTLILDKEVIPVNHVFYVSQIQNIAVEHATKNVERTDCSGVRLYPDLQINILGGANKYYINYTDSYSTDRGNRGTSATSEVPEWRQWKENRKAGK